MAWSSGTKAELSAGYVAVDHHSQSTRSLNDLVIEARSGDVGAVEELCARYQQRLTSVAGSAGADEPAPIVERALTQAMIAVGADPASDTMRFEADVFARVLAAVVPVEQVRASHNRPDEDDQLNVATQALKPLERQAVQLLPPGFETIAPTKRLVEPEIDDRGWSGAKIRALRDSGRSLSWRMWALPAFGAMVVAGLSIAGAYLLVQDDEKTSAGGSGPVGALADGLRNVVGSTSTSEAPPSTTTTSTTQRATSSTTTSAPSTSVLSSIASSPRAGATVTTSRPATTAADTTTAAETTTTLEPTSTVAPTTVLAPEEPTTTETAAP